MHPAAEVLLIEDEESDRQLVQELVALKGRGRVHITEAGDLHSGLALLDARPFDLVMLDTRLRDASALAALRAVGELRAEHADPVARHVPDRRDPPGGAPAWGMGRGGAGGLKSRCGRR